jgi:peptidoglycan/LPS O-acetylase OafA/YrhL
MLNRLKTLHCFSRITTAGRVFIPQIDGLRFIAIFAVVAAHVRVICSYHFMASPGGQVIEGDLTNDLFSVGHFGVQLFFMLSGFILAIPFARQWLAGGQTIKLRDYYVRRITRIEPPYLIHLVFLFFLCGLVLRWCPNQSHLYGNHDWAALVAHHLSASLIYSSGFIYGGGGYFPNIVLWSLEVEVQFYILAPFLARMFAINNSILRRSLIAMLVLLIPVVNHFFLARFLASRNKLGQSQIFSNRISVGGYLRSRRNGWFKKYMVGCNFPCSSYFGGRFTACWGINIFASLVFVFLRPVSFSWLTDV